MEDNTINKGKIFRKKVIDDEGVWIYRHHFDWRFPEIVSIERVTDKKDYCE